MLLRNIAGTWRFATVMGRSDGARASHSRSAHAIERVGRIIGLHGMEALMTRKLPVPEIPPVPSRRSDRAAAGSRLAPARTSPPKQTQEPELPNLLEAFWGDEASADEASGTRRARRHHDASPDPA
jgi:hypothetical protein